MQKKILVIDDENSDGNVIGHVLQEAGYCILLASSGSEAKEILSDNRVHLIILDMHMSGTSGLEFLRHLRDTRFVKIPVLMVSGSSDSSLRVESYGLGVYDFIKKPEEPEVILKRIENGLKIGDMIHFNETIKVELLMAQKLQQFLFPDPRLDTEHFKIAAFSRAFSDIGGDLYDYVLFRDGRLIFIVADVAGNSISASLYTAIVKMVFRNAIKHTEDPGGIVTYMNNQLCGNIPLELYVTMFCGIIDPLKGIFKYTNAGHPSPFCVSRDGVMALEEHDSFVGPIRNAQFRTFMMETHSLDGIFVYTDGMLDITIEMENLKGEKSFTEAVKGNKAGAFEFFRTLQDDLFNAPGRLKDDCTLMLIDFSGKYED